ncbi:hypothetical protein GCM10022267_31360 [Lentzea roselyniae]|uniref:Terpene synthase n=1 Tax=Lentzea roselyniae TaxID=531940 RepID=A0ABP7AWY5_9PSEU
MFDQRSIDYLTRFGLGGDEEQQARLAAGMGGIAGWLVPRGSEEGVQLFSDLAAWTFAFDDICDEGALHGRPGELAETTVRLLRVLEAPYLPIHGDPFAEALRAVRLRLDSLATPVQIGRWIEAMRGSFFVDLYKACNLVRGVTPTLDDFAYFRLYSGGALAFPVLTHIVDNIPLPQETWEDRRVRALTEMAASVPTWDSDIFSYVKESHRSGDGHNLIDAVRVTFGCSPQEALRKAVALRDRAMCRFLCLRDEVAAEGDPLLNRYLQSLGHYMRGVLDWGLSTERYRYLDGLSGGTVAFESMGVSETPSDDSPEPLPIASIAWWWKVGTHQDGTKS